MISFSVLAVFFGTLGLIWWLTQREKPDGRFKPIPGPMGVPGLGNILELGNGMHIPFKKWADKYGKICQMKMGGRTAIVISDPKWLKELFSMDFMAGRQLFEDFNFYPGEPLGITSIEGEMWEVHRRFLLRNLRDFGYGKSKLGDKILDEVQVTLDRLKEFENKPLTNVKEIMLVAVLNSLWLIAGSQHYKQDDPRIIGMHLGTNQLIADSTKYIIPFFMPWTKFLFSFLPKLDLEPHKKKAEEFYGAIIKSHEDTLQEDAPRDFIDMYLIEMRKDQNNPKSHFYGDKARRQLMIVLGDIMFAGTDTTSQTLQWSLLFLTKFKHYQEKVQQEIKEITGDTRLVTLADRPKMPFTLAVIDEILRYSSVAATGLQRRATVGTEFKGYFIPQDAWVFGNFHYIHHSEEIWGDPKQFRPERFLNPDGSYKKNENLMPFSTGRRQCIGEPLARDTTFLFLTNIIQRYSTRFDPSQPEPGLEPKLTNLFNGPPDYNLFLKDRLNQ